MGCDGWIEDPQKEFVVKLYCYSCGKDIDHDKPIAEHENCVNENGLPVRLELDNYLRR